MIDPIRPKIFGRAFFPGGYGLFEGVTQSFPVHPIMLVGQDFGTREYWNDVGIASESNQGTWSGLAGMLARARIDPCACFFTNVLLGVRVEGRIDGPSPGLAFEPYVEACANYLVEQIRVVRPSVVVALGKIPSILLSRQFGLTSALGPPSPNDARNPSWHAIDAAIEPFHPSSSSPGGVAFAFATSVHPDRYRINVRHRAWKSQGLKGEAAHDLIWSRVASTSSAEAESPPHIV
jgi:hypothetical protein